VPLEPDKAPSNGVSAPEAPPGRTVASQWRRIFRRLLFVVICAEVGVVLLVLPWLDIWGHNYLAGSGAAWYDFWMNMYFRGAVSGLGAINIYIFGLELFQLLVPLSRR
jgi:hypothetical protein